MKNIRSVVLPIVFAALAVAANSQRLAVLTPDDADSSRAYAVKLENDLARKAQVLDSDLARAAFDAAALRTPFNLTLDEGKHLGQAIGCDSFVLVRAAVQRRSSFERQEYYEGSAQIFVVSARTGRMVFWTNEKHEANTQPAAQADLDSSIGRVASSVLKAVNASNSTATSTSAQFPEVPDPDSPAAKGFRAPIPYRRIRPEYTAEASLYDVTATIDMMVDLDENGKIVSTEVTRWAGYGLDEAVDKAVRTMTWRPAERDGRFVPSRFMVRYNFKRPSKP